MPFFAPLRLCVKQLLAFFDPQPLDLNAPAGRTYRIHWICNRTIQITLWSSPSGLLPSVPWREGGRLYTPSSPVPKPAS